MTVIPRRERERQRHRQEILAAAAQLVDERGPEALTMDEIARRAEFAVGSVYRHFKSKDELLHALLIEQLAPFFRKVEEIAEGPGDFDTVLDAFLDAFVDIMKRLQPYLRFLLFLPHDPAKAPGADDAIEALIQWFDALRALIERGQADGRVVDRDPQFLATVLSGVLESVGKRAAFGLPVDYDEAKWLIRRMVLRGLSPEKVSK